MSVTLSLRFAQPSLAKHFGAIAGGVVSGSTLCFSLRDDSAIMRELFSLADLGLKKSQVTFWNVTCDLSIPLISDRSEVVGLLLERSTKNDFSLAKRGSERDSYNRPPACWDEPPRQNQLNVFSPYGSVAGHIAIACEETLLSKKLSASLGCDDSWLESSVRVNGRASSHWVRVYPPRATILAAHSLHAARPCAICGLPLVPKVGIWVSDSDSEVSSVLEDNIRAGHHRRLLVVPNEAADALHDCGSILSASPVYARSSSKGVLIANIVRCMEMI